MDLQERLQQKIDYLNGMFSKYEKLNDSTKGTYAWRLDGIQEQLIALEELCNDKELNRDWDICYEEDLRDSQV